MDELSLVYRTVIGWLIPAILVLVVHYLAEISKSLVKIRETLAVVMTRQENHEVRISRIETKIQRSEDFLA